MFDCDWTSDVCSSDLDFGRFTAERPKSRALFERARASLLGGVPMNWMVRWSGPFPLFVKEAQGAHFTDVDGHRYLDLCLGDTGAMTGHSPQAVAEAGAVQGPPCGDLLVAARGSV